MTKSRLCSAFAVIGLTLAMPMMVAAQVPTRPQLQVQPYTVGQSLPPVDSGKTLTPMTLEQALSRALEQNLDIQSARLDPRIQEYSLLSARAFFSPTLNLTYGYNNST